MFNNPSPVRHTAMCDMWLKIQLEKKTQQKKKNAQEHTKSIFYLFFTIFQHSTEEKKLFFRRFFFSFNSFQHSRLRLSSGHMSALHVQLQHRTVQTEKYDLLLLIFFPSFCSWLNACSQSTERIFFFAFAVAVQLTLDSVPFEKIIINK